MDLTPMLDWLQRSSLAIEIRDSLLLFPLIESTHVIGLTMVVGTITIVDLRLLGVASTSRSFLRLSADTLRWAWMAFAVTATTGALMFITNADVYFHNFYFRTKMALLLLAGINVAVFELTAGRTVERWDTARSAPPIGRAVAVASLILWVGVIVAGRMIGFTTTRGALNEPPPADINFEELLGLPSDTDTPPTPGK